MVLGPPQLTHSFLKWITTQDTKDKTILEFGSGGSTVFFSKIFKQVISFESNPEYMKEVQKQIPDNVFLYPFTFEKFPQVLEGVDYILIDNNPGKSIQRSRIAEKIIEYGYKNIIILDNGNWNPTAYFYLRKMCKEYRDFGWHNTAGSETITSVFSGILDTSSDALEFEYGLEFARIQNIKKGGKWTRSH